MSSKVVFVTEDRYENPKSFDYFSKNILADDAILIGELERLSHECIRVSWSNKSFDWEAQSNILIRTPWDYFERKQEFDNWLSRLQNIQNIINPLELIKWNLDKTYLLDLKKSGIKIVDTVYVKQGTSADLSQIAFKNNWQEIIIKPTISAGAFETFRLKDKELNEWQDKFDSLTQQHTMMVQPFMKNIISSGEISLVVIGGKFVHSILKKAKQNDFRVQDDHGGTLHEYRATKEEIAFAEQVVKASPFPAAYARVDIVQDENSEIQLMELEAIEPELWFRDHPESGIKLAREVAKIVQQD